MPNPYCFDPAGLEPGVLLPGYRIVGERPETFTLGFRWSAADNMFTNAGLIAIEEWRKLNASVDEQSDERKLRQFVWALPTEDTSESTLTVSASAVRRRLGGLDRGAVPSDWFFSGFLDLGQRVCHWGVAAGLERFAAVDTGVIEVPTGDRTVEEGLKLAMWEWYDRVVLGWASGIMNYESGIMNVGLESPPSTGGNEGVGLESPPSMGGNVGARRPGIVLVDSGRWTSVVYEFIREVSQLNSGVMWFASKGHGLSQDQGRVYAMPDQVSGKIPYVGDRYHVRLQEAHGIYLMHMDSDAWKSRIHSGLTVPPGEPGSLVLWSATPEDTDIWTLAKHLTSERGVVEFDPKRGNVQRWERVNRNNHFLDCFYGCLVGLDYLRVVHEAAAATRAARGKGGAPASAPGAASGGGGEGPFRWTRE